MERKQPSIELCRICRVPISSMGRNFPFCSEACREQDLGNWASESYRVVAGYPDEADMEDFSGPETRLDD